MLWSYLKQIFFLKDFKSIQYEALNALLKATNKKIQNIKDSPFAIKINYNYLELICQINAIISLDTANLITQKLHFDLTPFKFILNLEDEKRYEN